MGASVSAECGTFRQQVETDVDGRYSLQLPSGTYRLSVAVPKFSTVTQELTITSGGRNPERDISLTLEQVKSSVTVTAEPGYVVTESAAGTKTSTPLLDVPQAITVVDRQLLDDQGAVKIDDALKNVAGVMPGGYYDGWDYYRIRGFDASFTTYIDGLRGGNGMAEETFGLESVEVIKGPSSALYGESVLGGLVNLRSKRPGSEGFAKVQFTGGSFGFLEPAIDIGGPLNSSHTVYARLTGLYRMQDSFSNYAYKHRSYIAPALTWEINPSTTLTFLSRFQRDNGRHAFPLPAEGTVLPNINGELPISTYSGELGSANKVEESNKQFGYQFTHRFNDSISFHQNLRLDWYQNDWNHLLYPGFLDADQRTLYRYPLDWAGNWNDYAVDSGLEATFKTGSVRHNVLVGLDYYRQPNEYHGESIDFADPSQYMPIDLFHPVYGTTPFPVLQPYSSGKTITQFTGVYLQDQARLLRRLTLTLGGRFDYATNHEEPDPSHTNTAFTPRVGLTYELVPGAALYTSFSKSFLPQTGRMFDGSSSGGFVPPETGQQWEAGVKTSLVGGRLSTTLAVYQLSRKNVITTDPVHPNFYLLTGEQRSRGVELETALRLRPGWNLTAAYALTNAKVTEDSDIPVGTPTQNVPRHSFNIWSTYEVQHGWARGLGLGFGGTYYTDQSGDLLDTFKIPGYGLVNASVFYRRRHLSWQLNLNNLADNRYFTGSYDALYVKPGEPRVVRSTVAWTF